MAMKRSDNLVWVIMGTLSLVLILGIIGLSLTGFITFSGGEIVPDVNTIALWHLNGDAQDSAGTNTGTLMDNTICSVQGKFNQGCQFDGTGDYINIGDANLVENLNEFSVCVWVKNDLTDSAGVDRGVIGQSGSGADSFDLFWESTEKFGFNVKGPQDSSHVVSSNVAIIDNGWHHLVGVYDGSNVLLYIDSVLQTEQSAFLADVQSSTNPIRIGQRGSSSFGWQGVIDEVAIFDKALTQSEVSELFAAGGGACVESWTTCSSWSVCSGGTQTRTCTDDNNCGTTNNKPAESQSCVETCTDGQTRSCGSDVGECQVGTQTCTSGVWGSCVGETASRTEICGNGLDEDCSGSDLICSQGGGTWIPPIGIPRPSFGIEESYRIYDNVANRNPSLTYNPSSSGGFYTHYVDRRDASCTDTNNDFGSASNPRCTIPLGSNKALPEGSVMEIYGEHINYNDNTNPMRFFAYGTPQRPVFVRGTSLLTNRIGDDIGGTKFYLEGDSTYTIIENLNFEGSRFRFGEKAHHVAIRHSEIKNAFDIGGGSALGNGARDTDDRAHDLVIYNMSIHNIGPAKTNLDADTLCVLAGLSYNFWLVDSEMSYCAGDGFQTTTSNLGLTRTHHLYIGRNKFHHNRQTGIYAKYGKDIVISQNEVYGHKRSTSATGEGIGPGGAGYQAERVWVLFNKIYDNDQGIRMNTLGNATYMIGNVIYDIHHSVDFWWVSTSLNGIASNEYSPTSAGAFGSAFSIRNGDDIYISHN